MSLVPADWIQQSIRINTETHRSNSELVQFLGPLLTRSGLTVTEQQFMENGVRFLNVIAYSHSLQSPDLMVFNTHLDTVSAGNPDHWNKTGGDPFKATLSRGRIYGLGTADVKLDFLCKILAAQRSRPWGHPICLVGTYGEERGLVGASRLLESAQIKPRYAIVGEPSNLELVYAHKGQLVLTVAIPRVHRPVIFKKQWHGRTAHSSTPELGSNALLKGLTDCFKRAQGILTIEAGTNPNCIPEHCAIESEGSTNSVSQSLFALVGFLGDTHRELLKRRDLRFSPPTCTLSLTHATTRPHHIEITLDVRLLPDVNIEKLRARFFAGLSALGLQVVYDEMNFPLKGKRDSLLIKHAVRTLKGCKVQPLCKTKASATEASLYQRQGAEAFVFGPGASVGNVHRPNEHNLIRHLDLAVHFYTRLMQMPPGAS